LKNTENETIILNPCGLIANTLFNDVITLESGVDSDGNPLVMLENGIAWQSDLDYKFKQPDDFFSQMVDCPNGCDETCECDSTGLPDNFPDDFCTNGSMYEDTDGQCYRYLYPDDDTTQYLYETYPMVVNPIEGVENEHFVVWMRNAAFPKFRKLYGYMDKGISKGAEITFTIQANWVVHSFKGSKTLVLTTTSIFGGKNPKLGWFFIGVGIFCFLAGSLFGLKQYFKPRKLADTKYLKYKEE